MWRRERRGSKRGEREMERKKGVEIMEKKDERRGKGNGRKMERREDVDADGEFK